MKHLMPIAIGLLIAGSAPGAERLTIGHPDIDPTFIQDYSSAFDLVRIDPDGSRHPQGHWTDEVHVAREGGRAVMRREVARFQPDGVEDLWRVHRVDAATLAPVLSDNRHGPDLRIVTHLDFAGPEVTATLVPNPEASAMRATFSLDESPFDLSIWATLLMSIPFEEGYQAEIPVLGQGGVLNWETITVEGREWIEIPSGERVETWKVSTTQRPWTAWLSKQRSPYIIKTLQRFPDGTHWESMLRN